MSEQNNQQACVRMESVDRITKLPLVEGTWQTGKSIYDKVKDYNSITNWTMSTAESTVSKAVEVGMPYATPVVQKMEGPIKKVDGMLCSGLDFVEANVPAVKIPPGELYTSTKEYVASNPTVQTACAVVQPKFQTAKNQMEQVVETAKTTVQGAKSMVEPAMSTAKVMVEPYVQSSLEKAAALRDYGTQKIEEYMHAGAKQEQKPEAEEEKKEEGGSSAPECSDCQ
ncbi:PREDICTED: lipid storage droplets surface-binding protein 1-like isoform X2 [Nicrophorus vespilloides]|uniref:Lipid storage droplets surface-binding protein 1-like isoform X2 n=1 Tax=Nicrophorus vespilloides TaxID=110193 RepID=A0ABM1M4Y6_NICVS|nr:PREDICTED: lipid storage droplets surface-binding protein 1-like isoform X2 [Nicrophorus vespilloides]